MNEEWLGKSGLGLYADFVIETHAIVAQALAALDESGAADNTLVIITSDNGCAHYEKLITNGRSTPGEKQPNDAKVIRYPK